MDKMLVLAFICMVGAIILFGLAIMFMNQGSEASTTPRITEYTDDVGTHIECVINDLGIVTFPIKHSAAFMKFRQEAYEQGYQVGYKQAKYKGE
jgi:hypothetical protein